jgi:Ca2+:H+ antiporter
MPRWLYYLLIMAVVAPVVDLFWGPQQALAIFICSTIALIPLAAMIGDITEGLEEYVGPTAGGLLNATFGNAPELIIGIFALHAGLISVVKASMTGSIISNSLLVLGSSLAIGGWRWGRQYFNARDAGQYSAMLLLALAGFAVPSIGSLTIQDPGDQQLVSIAVSCVLLLVYALYLTSHVFRVHADRRNPHQAEQRKAALQSVASVPDEDEANEDVKPETSEEHPHMPLWLLLLLLLIITPFIAWNSELLVGTIEPVTKLLGWSPVFVGLVIIPIVGNAAEHSSAIYIAVRDRVDLSMAIAAGSSIQVATFVSPLLVLLSMFSRTHMTLIFPWLELAILAVAALLFPVISLDGESSWLSGVQLIAVYIIACILFFFIPG